MKRTGVFDVDTEGMRRIALRRGATPLVCELIQNAWDEPGVTVVSVTLKPTDRPARWLLEVEDDAPAGFADLTDAWTMYGESKKRDNPELRGFMDIGEKFVIAACESAEIFTTRGYVSFDDRGRHINSRKRKAGTLFSGVLRITKPQGQAALRDLLTLIPPAHIQTTINGTPLLVRTPIASINASLQTTVPNDEGVMERRQRRTTISIYEPLPGETATLYEMGLPVVDTGDQYHVDINQRVPLNSERDNVPPAYLRAVRVLVLEATANRLDREHAAETWVREAAADPRTSNESITKVLDARFGTKRVSFDPSDPEANKIAVANGYTVVHGGSMSTDEWAQARRAEAIKPAGQVTPSPSVEYSNDPEAKTERRVKPDNWTPGMRAVADQAIWMARALLNIDLTVEMINEPIARNHRAAWYGVRTLSFNVGVLGYRWFDNDPLSEPVLELILHELAHEIESDHLSSRYTQAVCTLAGRAVALALRGGWNGGVRPGTPAVAREAAAQAWVDQHYASDGRRRKS